MTSYTLKARQSAQVSWADSCSLTNWSVQIRQPAPFGRVIALHNAADHKMGQRNITEEVYHMTKSETNPKCSPRRQMLRAKLQMLPRQTLGSGILNRFGQRSPKQLSKPASSKAKWRSKLLKAAWKGLRA